jgi:DUF4097 and DUF4098 domain-containing protein YvlB
MSRAIAISATVLCVLVPAGVLAGVSETFEWSGAAEVKELKIENVSGDIDVEVAGEEIKLIATKKAEDKTALERTAIVVMKSGHIVEVKVNYGDGSDEAGDVENQNGAAVDFVVTVPAGLERLELTTASGDITTAGVPHVKAGAASGDLDISGAFEKASARTAQGDITIKNEGEATSRINVEAVSGDVDVNAALPAADAKYRVSTVSGNVELALSGETGNYDVDVDLISGKCESDLPLERGGGVVGGSYSGRAGAGTNDVKISTVNGDVEISTP